MNRRTEEVMRVRLQMPQLFQENIKKMAAIAWLDTFSKKLQQLWKSGLPLMTDLPGAMLNILQPNQLDLVRGQLSILAKLTIVLHYSVRH